MDVTAPIIAILSGHAKQGQSMVCQISFLPQMNISAVFVLANHPERRIWL
jgi:hypothetical protein